MPWCPKCRNEYRKGILFCADCNTELTDELTDEIEYSLVAGVADEELANRLIQFINAQNIEGELRFSEEDNGYHILVPKKDFKQAKKLYLAFYSVELENATKEAQKAKPPKDSEDDTGELSEIASENLEETEMADDEDSDEQASDSEEDAKERNRKIMGAPSSTYVKKAEKSKDLKSTAYTFFFFGTAGILFLILNVMNILPWFNNPLSLTVMGLMFLGCFYIAATSWRDAKKADIDAIEEESLTKTLNEWLDSNITEEVLLSFTDESLSDELNYMAKIDGIKQMVTKAVGELDDSYLDHVVEEFYSRKFED